MDIEVETTLTITVSGKQAKLLQYGLELTVQDMDHHDARFYEAVEMRDMLGVIVDPEQYR